MTLNDDNVLSMSHVTAHTVYRKQYTRVTHSTTRNTQHTQQHTAHITQHTAHSTQHTAHTHQVGMFTLKWRIGSIDCEPYSLSMPISLSYILPDSLPVREHVWVWGIDPRCGECVVWQKFKIIMVLGRWKVQKPSNEKFWFSSKRSDSADSKKTLVWISRIVWGVLVYHPFRLHFIQIENLQQIKHIFTANLFFIR